MNRVQKHFQLIFFPEDYKYIDDLDKIYRNATSIWSIFSQILHVGLRIKLLLLLPFSYFFLILWEVAAADNPYDQDNKDKSDSQSYTNYKEKLNHIICWWTVSFIFGFSSSLQFRGSRRWLDVRPWTIIFWNTKILSVNNIFLI